MKAETAVKEKSNLIVSAANKNEYSVLGKSVIKKEMCIRDRSGPA